MKIYLASPLFTAEEKENVRKVAKYLRGLGHDVFVPMEQKIEDAWVIPNGKWANQVYCIDEMAICNSEAVVAIIYGMTDDAGTAWEIGYAHGIGKTIYLCPVNETTYSLMIGCSAEMIFSGTKEIFGTDWNKCTLG